MNRFYAKSEFCAYLKRYNISFIEDFEKQLKMIFHLCGRSGTKRKEKFIGDGSDAESTDDFKSYFCHSWQG